MGERTIYSTVIGRSDMTFQVFVGTRGIGKTYSSLKEMYTNEHLHRRPESKFIYLRRTEADVKRLLSTKHDDKNPFKKLNKDNGWNIHVEYSSSESTGYIYRDKDDRTSLFGYMLPLSVFGSLRGVDFSDVDCTIFDEIIPEKSLMTNNLGDAFLHFYESVNRNRELEGESPMRVYMLGNAIALDNDILLAMNLISKMAAMIAKKQSRMTDKERGIYVELMENLDFERAKGETALYKMAKGTSFSRQALNNEFTVDDFRPIKDVPLNEYKPLFAFGDFTVFQHKSKGELYIARKKSVNVVRFEELDADVMYWRFAPRYRQAVLARAVKYDDYGTKLVFDSLTSRKNIKL